MTDTGSTISSTGLPTTTAGVLCYLGWWVTGAIFWLLERDDRRVRLHAAQSVIAFGGLTLLILILSVLGMLALSFAPAIVFSVLVFAGVAAAALALGVWVVALWSTWRGDTWRMPVVGPLADAWLARKDGRVTTARPT